MTDLCSADRLLLLLLLLGASCSEAADTGSQSTTAVEASRWLCNNTQVEPGGREVSCGDGWCVAESALCNGVPDCAGGEDEGVPHCGCLPNEFRCSNSCIDLVQRCDRDVDCPNGEDEDGCESFVCPVTHFKCANHFCVPEDAVCNFGDDCGDGSDEQSCSHRSCWKSEFRCDNGECIRPGFVCDGVVDCKDASDEVHCTPAEFRICGDGTRVHKFFWCDGWPHCHDNHADELNCTECRGQDEYLCPNGRCIRRANVCDSYCDCVPASRGQPCADEVDCAGRYLKEYGVSVCTPGETLSCVLPSNKKHREERCISSDFICDGYNDCHNGRYISDEFGCDSFKLVSTEDLFNCSEGRAIPLSLVCDFKRDCLNGEDEQFCGKKSCSVKEFTCANGQCIPLELVCDLSFDCWDKTDEMNCTNQKCSQGYRKCRYNGQCIPATWWCDYSIDCFDGSDEEECESGQHACKSNEFRCNNGQCVPADLRCFKSGIDHAACADGSHLFNCDNWTCPDGTFKCRNGPCLNNSLVCNRNIDCKDTWVDEDHCPFECCSDSRCFCLDTKINCSTLGLKTLPDGIEIQINRFYMANNLLNYSLNVDTFSKLDRLLYLDLRNNSISWLPPMMFRNLWRLHILNLQNNNLSVISNGTFFGLPKLGTLHLHGNNIQSLEPMAFYGLSSLKALDLKRQRISNISHGAFIGLRSLVTLDMSYNCIAYLTDGTLIGMPKLETLDLSGNSIRTVGSTVFKSVRSLKRLTTDEYRFCCLARHVSVCMPPPDEFSSCEDLMSNLVLRVCVWILGIMATLGNTLVIVWRKCFRHPNKVHSFLITNLAIGDLLMGVYLLIIGSADTYYRGVYSVHDRDWRSSGLCHTAGFLSTFSSEFSVYTLTVIALDRFLVILFPFHVRTMKMTKTRILIAGGWLGAAFLSGLPFIHISYFKNFYGRSGVCLALHITPQKYNGWEYSVFVFLFLNLASFSVIAVGYTSMFVIARTTQQAAQMNQKTAESAVIARRMTLIVATDAACWMPIICLGILSLAGTTVPPQVYAWIAVFVLPLNAAINPILYTISTTPFLEPTLKGLKTLKRSCRLSLTTEQHHTYSSVTASEHQHDYNLHGHPFMIDAGHSIGNDKYKKKQQENCNDTSEEDGEHFFSASECQQHLHLTSKNCHTEAMCHSFPSAELVMSNSHFSERCTYPDIQVQVELLPLQQMPVDM
ncbi:G-protein coupled receptor GRL101-like [Schistocerca gregaria]|uniref:G-protein coupled receptor GRL101-like n=1 Tax=Schistocerca gregaria TaxID=7010 RepID=UPI00211F1576|nr:G-protein coupled receptor GRL101-like [Schistocerca gregaria]